MKFNLNSFLLATSVALDYAEKEILNTTTHHSKRCAYISLRIGLELGLSQEECFDLCSLALMHDSGITQAFYNQDLLKPGEKKNLLYLEKFLEHPRIGEKNVEEFPFLTSPKNVILYHHEYLDGSGHYGVEGKDIPLMAQIIGFADDIDKKFNLLDSNIDSLREVHRFVQEGRGRLYSEEIVDTFSILSDKISFWRDLCEENLISSIETYLPQIENSLELSDLLHISFVFSKIIDAKSPSTAAHSNALMSKAKDVAKFLDWDYEKSIYFQIAANLHDIGSLGTPRKILKKEHSLGFDEFEEVKLHVQLTHTILKSITGFEKVCQWASRHHERIDGSGYPFGITKEELCFESKLLACLDVYQALLEERPHRKEHSHEEAIEILYEHVQKKLFEKEIVDLIVTVFS